MNPVGYTIQLDKLDGEARRVVGEVAMRNFGFVRDRLRSWGWRADLAEFQALLNYPVEGSVAMLAVPVVPLAGQSVLLP